MKQHIIYILTCFALLTSCGNSVPLNERDSPEIFAHFIETFVYNETFDVPDYLVDDTETSYMEDSPRDKHYIGKIKDVEIEIRTTDDHVVMVVILCEGKQFAKNVLPTATKVYGDLVKSYEDKPGIKVAAGVAEDLNGLKVSYFDYKYYYFEKVGEAEIKLYQMEDGYYSDNSLWLSERTKFRAQ